MTTPTLLIGLFILFKDKFSSLQVKFLISLYFFLIILPIMLYVLARPIEDMRFVGISVFTQWKNDYPTDSLVSFLSVTDLLGRITTNYFKHFDPHLLFGDNSLLRYYHLRGLGLYYLWQAPFMLIGIAYTIKTIGQRENKLILFWLILSLIPASFTTGVPNANIGRILMVLLVMEFFCARGTLLCLYFLYRTKRVAYVLAIIILTFISTQAIHQFITNYFVKMPHEFSFAWAKNFAVATPLITTYEKNVDKIIITDPTNQSYIYVLFYGNKEPKWLFTSSKKVSPIIGYSSIDKYEFRSIDWQRDKLLKNTLIVGTQEEIQMQDSDLMSVEEVKKIYDLFIIKTKK